MQREREWERVREREREGGEREGEREREREIMEQTSEKLHREVEFCIAYLSSSRLYTVCTCIYVAYYILFFQLLEMMGSIIERPLVHRDFQFKYPLLLTMYDRELDEGKAIFNQQHALQQASQV